MFTDCTDICGCFFFFSPPLIFVVIEYFVGDFNGMTSNPSFACGYERSLCILLTETNLDRWHTSNGFTSKIFLFHVPLPYKQGVCVFLKESLRRPYIVYSFVYFWRIFLCNGIEMINKTEETLRVPEKKGIKQIAQMYRLVL